MVSHVTGLDDKVKGLICRQVGWLAGSLVGGWASG